MKEIQMKIQMIRSRLGSNDGATTQMYIEGEQYDVSGALAEVFKAEGVCTFVDAAPVEEAAPVEAATEEIAPVEEAVPEDAAPVKATKKK